MLAIFATFMTLHQTAGAHEFKAGSITIEHPWARPSATENGAAYFELVNGGTEADRLIGASAAIAGAVELHVTSIDAQGVATMRPVQAVDLPAGGRARLSPGGLHLMLLGLTQPLEEGQSFPLTLTFEHAGAATVDVEVERQPEHGSSSSHHAPAPAN
jgi:copper(I)-binding protein